MICIVRRFWNNIPLICSLQNSSTNLRTNTAKSSKSYYVVTENSISTILISMNTYKSTGGINLTVFTVQDVYLLNALFLWLSYIPVDVIITRSTDYYFSANSQIRVWLTVVIKSKNYELPTICKLLLDLCQVQKCPINFIPIVSELHQTI